MVKVKICGITNTEDALKACELGADALGFIFVKSSPRYIDPVAAKKIMATLPPFVTKVGVFVNEEHAFIRAIADDCGLNAVQLHGDEQPELCNRLAIAVIKAFKVHEHFDLNSLAEFVCSAYLLDTYSRDAYGGTGKTFDWQIAQKAREYGRIILAGGLNPGNIGQAIKTAEPYAVDISSGIEKQPGIKDHTKMHQLFDRLRKGNYN